MTKKVVILIAINYKKLGRNCDHFSARSTRKFGLNFLQSFALSFRDEKDENGRKTADATEDPEGDRLSQRLCHYGEHFGDREDEEPVGHNGDGAGDGLRFRWE